jgi:hypothetical protein
VTTIHYDPTSEFDVPAGTYTVRFEGLVDKEPFENSRYAKPGEAPEARWGWRFRILGSEQDGKLIEQDTGRKATRKAKLTQLLSWLMGGNLQPGTDVRVEDLVGRTYRLIWAANPNSEKGNNHVHHLEPVAGTGTGTAPTEAPPPPPPATAGDRFWVLVDGKVVQKDRAAIAATIQEEQLPPASLMLRPAGSSQWVPASTLGFAEPIPY